MNNIKEAIRKLAQGSAQTVSLICTVDSVDETARTIDCTPIDDSAPLLGVNLQANQESDFGLVLFPKVGSYVVVGFIAEGSAGVVLLTDEVERAEFTIKGDQTVTATVDGASVNISVGDSTSAVLTKDGIVLNGGDLGGLVKVEALTTKLNELIDAFNSHTHLMPSGLVAVTGSPSAQSNPAPITVPKPTTPHTKVQRSDYENEKVKQ